MILILSNLLSYSLYESKAERVTLERELNAVADLISLEKMKGSDEIFVHVDQNIETQLLLVPPMLIVSVLRECRAESVAVREDAETLIIEISIHKRPPHKIEVEKIYKEEYEPA